MSPKCSSLRFATCMPLLLVVLSTILTGCRAEPDLRGRFSKASTAPAHCLSKNDVHAMVYLPDAEKGHYRGQRFDWSGMIGAAVFGDRVFWEEWNESDDPTGHDANATGPAMEFDIDAPVGYADAAVGEGFIKIGVGVLQRVTAGPYRFMDKYPILDKGVWTVNHSRSAIDFRHQLRHRSYGYDYRKRVSIADDRTMTIACRLTNTGTETIDTEVYVHNFFRLNGYGWVPGLEINFDEPVQPSPQAKPQEAVAGAGVAWKTRPLLKDKSVWLPLVFDPTHQPRRFSIRSDTAELRVGLDFDPSRFVLFGLTDTVCVEPFLRIRLPAGETREWSYTYQFFEADQKASSRLADERIRP